MSDQPESNGPIDHFWSVIPAGGAGTRLWPLSRAGRPKFLHDLTDDGSSLLQATAGRLSPLCGSRVMVVTGVAHEDAVRAQLPDLGVDGLIAEPSPRDSMAAIGLAAAVIERIDPDAVIGSFAADHVIGDEDSFRDCVREAVAVAAAQGDRLVTLGITPTFPATGFGYILPGEPLALDLAPRARMVADFVEKPDAQTAAGYLQDGALWNAGMFVARASVLLDLLAAYQPALATGLRAIAAAPGRLAEIWPGLAKISIDHAVAEPASREGRVAVVPADFAWDDVGDFNALATLLPTGPDLPEDLHVLGDATQVVSHDASGVVVPGSGRLVAVVGIPDIVVVDTPDALLITTRDRAQDVKSIVDELKATGRASLT